MAIPGIPETRCERSEIKSEIGQWAEVIKFSGAKAD